MNHYPHHIGDFDRATRHLTRIERSIYRDLMDLYYETEKSLMADITKLARRIVCTGKKDIAALVIVLEEFFTLDDSGWRNTRCEAEIAAYRARGISAAAAGKASAAKRSAPGQPGEETPLNAGSTTVQRQPNDGSTDAQRKSNQPEPKPKPEPEPNKTHAVVDNEDDAQANEQPARVSKAGAICMVIKSEGVGIVSPQNPKLLALIDKGADVGHFAEAAKATSAKGKGFGYLLAVVEGQMSEAAQMASRPMQSISQCGNQGQSSARPLNKQEALEASNRLVADEAIAIFKAKHGINKNETV